MFQQAIPTEMKNKVRKLDENRNFLNEIIRSLSETYEGHVKWDRESNLKTKVQFSSTYNDFRNDCAITFVVTEKGVEFSGTIWYQTLGRLNLKEVYAAKPLEKNKKIAYEFKSTYYPKNLVGKKLPKWVKIKQYKSGSCGNSYNFSFNLKKSDKTLNKKIELITNILLTLGFKIQFGAVA